MQIKITRTIYGAQLQTSLLLGLPYTQVQNSTLNEKFDIQADVQPNSGSTPSCRYFCIGYGGHEILTGTDGTPYTSPIQHAPDDAACYNHLPFIIRTTDNDLTTGERAKYALRKTVTFGGVNYYAYYLKRLDMTNIVPTMMYNAVEDGNTTSTPFVPTSANLNPVAPDVPINGVVTTTGDYLSTSAILNLAYADVDVDELINVAQIMFNNELRAVISEIGLVAASDKMVTAPNSQLNYLEAVGAIIVTHITAYYSMGFTNKGFDLNVEVGATNPMIGVTTVDSGP